MSPLASIIIPTRDQFQMLSTCIASVRGKTACKPYEIIVVDNQTSDTDALQYMTSLVASGMARVIRYEQPFNFPAMNNLAAWEARGSVLVFLNNDVEVISPGWLDELVSLAFVPQNGAVGAMLYYANDTIQHAGIEVGKGGIARHAFKGRRRGYVDPDGYLKQRQNVTAVTAACMAIRKDLFLEVGGFDEVNLPVNFNDVDLCLRLQEKGYKNVWTPFAELYHHESATRKPEARIFKSRRFKGEIGYMMARWEEVGCRRTEVRGRKSEVRT
ncbi:MAG: glycosyltransferase family 2 protein [bacterium]